MVAWDIAIYSGLGEEISSFDCALLPRHGPVAQRVRTLNILKGRQVPYILAAGFPGGKACI